MNKIPGTRITKRAAAFLADPRRALAVAAVLHLLITLLIFTVGICRISPEQWDEHGIGEFAQDGHTYRVQAESLAHRLQQFDLSAWLRDSAPFHVKLYSICFALLGPLLGANILAAEPLNLFCYLTILLLTFSLAKMIAGQRTAWLAAIIVALWPSLLLHTTQLLRDQVFIAAMLALIFVLTNLLAKTNSVLRGLAVGGGGALAYLVFSLTRTEMRLVATAIVFIGVGLFLIRMLRERRLLAGNLLGIIVLIIAMVIPARQVQPAPGSTVPGSAPVIADPSLWAHIATLRRRFAVQYPSSGSNIDADVQFSSAGDVIRYVPRALEIGLLAPFPEMWFQPRRFVGMAGRPLLAVETSLTYVLTALACMFTWKRRRCLPVWMLAFAVLTGATALGLVVTNLGALYRMRYGFWVLLTIVGSGALAGFFRRIGSGRDGTGDLGL